MNTAHAAWLALVPNRERAIIALGVALAVALELAAPSMGVAGSFGLLTSILFVGPPFLLGFGYHEICSREILALMPGHRERLLRAILAIPLPASFAIAAAALSVSTGSIAEGFGAAAFAHATGFALGCTGLRNMAVGVACILPWLALELHVDDDPTLVRHAVLVHGLCAMLIIASASLAAMISITWFTSTYRAFAGRAPVAVAPTRLAVAWLRPIGADGATLRAAWNIGVIHLGGMCTRGSGLFLIALVLALGLIPMPAPWAAGACLFMVLFAGMVPAITTIAVTRDAAGRPGAHHGMAHLALLRRVALGRDQVARAWILGMLLFTLGGAAWAGVAVAGGAILRAALGQGIAPDPAGLALVALAAAVAGAVIASLMATVQSLWLRLAGIYVAMFVPDAAFLNGSISGPLLAACIFVPAALLMPWAWLRLQAAETA